MRWLNMFYKVINIMDKEKTLEEMVTMLFKGSEQFPKLFKLMADPDYKDEFIAFTKLLISAGKDAIKAIKATPN